MAVAPDYVFGARQLFDADRAAGVQLAGGDADLGPHAELAAVGELGRGIDQDDGAVDLFNEGIRRFLVGGDDAVRVLGAVFVDVFDGLLDAVDDPDRDDRMNLLAKKRLVSGRKRA